MPTDGSTNEDSTDLDEEILRREAGELIHDVLLASVNESEPSQQVWLQIRQAIDMENEEA